MTVWELIKADRFEEACLEADRRFAAGSLSDELNKAIALLKLGRFNEAEFQCKRSQDRPERSRWGDVQGEWDLLGVAQWLQNKREAATESWKRSMEAKYVDLSGGAGSRLLLFYGAKAQKAPDVETLALRSLETFVGRNGWPAPLASFVLGRIREGDVGDWISPIEALRCKESCQTEFILEFLKRIPQSGFNICGRPPMTLCRLPIPNLNITWRCLSFTSQTRKSAR